MKKMNFISSFCVALIVGFSACKKNSIPNVTEINKNTEDPKLKQTEIVAGQEIVWGMDWLPNGDLIFTERKGKIKVLSKGTVTELTGIPSDFIAANQGGMFDIKVHPNYTKNGWIYATYSGTEAGATNLKLIRFKLKNSVLDEVKVLLQASPTNKWRGHYGSRIDFGNDGKLYVSIGEGGSTSRGGRNSANQNSQNVKELWGKVHRINDDGSIPNDNPILPGNDGPTSIYSYGHRNPQGLAIDQETGIIYESEHGPKGGDELNIVQKGANYGWPWISYGVNYDGVSISDDPKMEGMKDPIHNYVPSIGACGLAIIKSKMFPEWNGQLLLGGLAKNYLSRVQLKDGKFEKEVKMLENIGRMRDVNIGPDGAIYVSLENPGRIVKIEREK